MESEESQKRSKRSHTDFAGQDAAVNSRPSDESSSDDDDDDDMGPQLPTGAPPKKRRVLPYERVYTAALPKAPRYSRSLMHKEPLSFVTVTPITEFLITSSVDGVVKFWKKVALGIEFVKEYHAHQGLITSVSVSGDGRSFATAGVDGTVKIFDVVTFDLLSTLALDFTAGCVCWVHKKGASIPLLAVAEEGRPPVHMFDGRGEKQVPIHTIKNLHRNPVCVMAMNDGFDCVVSVDTGGTVEYWRPSGGYDKPDNVFEYKSATSLFEFKKAKAVPCGITISPSGKQFASFSLPDRKIRILDFATGKLLRTYDESLKVQEEMQQAGTDAQRLDGIEFGRRMALEKEIDVPDMRNKPNVVFDESGHFVIYGSMVGIKVVNTYTNQVVRVYGKEDNLRAVNLALYQGAPQKKGVTTVEMGASSNPLLQESEARDPILVATAVGKQRFYMFTNDDGVARSARDVQNEKPTVLGGVKKVVVETKKIETGTSAVIHTTFGDIHMRLFADAAPRAVENFVTHSRRGYYNNTIFHRVIRKFMIQCGDPLGDGTGGESIWGKHFDDEFGSLKHDKPYTVSMANAGPDTNGSQFFITTEKTPWLDGKHTVFGRATHGLDVIHKIENVRTHKDKPLEDIKIINIDVT